MNLISGQGTLLLPSIVKPKPVDGVLMEATVRNVRVCRIGTKAKVYSWNV